ncbi:hypothetical protein SCHPADRAFT_896602 [Schizopora paradoxa]|uniref:Uncharacterized protein n=1 Tax=Schizopora paradoxa TaxID=27342 RepID=A0A0H2R6D1_9AGAM|nr:hypothetical protein SCHPADRAFT_896602 [Schizopora paradoxa]
MLNIISGSLGYQASRDLTERAPEGTLQGSLLPEILQAISVDLDRRVHTTSSTFSDVEQIRKVPSPLPSTLIIFDVTTTMPKALPPKSRQQRCKCPPCIRKGGKNGCLVDASTKRSHENRMVNADTANDVERAFSSGSSVAQRPFSFPPSIPHLDAIKPASTSSHPDLSERTPSSCNGRTDRADSVSLEADAEADGVPPSAAAASGSVQFAGHGAATHGAIAVTSKEMETETEMEMEMEMGMDAEMDAGIDLEGSNNDPWLYNYRSTPPSPPRSPSPLAEENGFQSPTLSEDPDLEVPSRAISEAPLDENPREGEANGPQIEPTQSRRNRDVTFRFSPRDPPPPALETLASCDPHPFWQIILLMVACLNLRFHLPHRACSLILQVLKVVFISLGLFKQGHKPATTLNTTFAHLGLRDEPFDIFPMCTDCHRIFPADTSPETNCSHCEIPLFQPIRVLESNFDGVLEHDTGVSSDPKLKCPIRALSSQLAEFVNAHGNEDACDAWRSKLPTPGVLADITDGEKWKTIAGPDGKPFFDNDPHRESKDELCLAVTLGFDGFGGERGRGGPSYSSGVLSHCVANLPVHLNNLTNPNQSQVFLGFGTIRPGHSFDGHLEVNSVSWGKRWQWPSGIQSNRAVGDLIFKHHLVIKGATHASMAYNVSHGNNFNKFPLKNNLELSHSNINTKYLLENGKKWKSIYEAEVGLRYWLLVSARKNDLGVYCYALPLSKRPVNALVVDENRPSLLLVRVRYVVSTRCKAGLTPSVLGGMLEARACSTRTDANSRRGARRTLPLVLTSSPPPPAQERRSPALKTSRRRVNGIAAAYAFAQRSKVWEVDEHEREPSTTATLYRGPHPHHPLPSLPPSRSPARARSKYTVDVIGAILVWTRVVHSARGRSIRPVDAAAVVLERDAHAERTARRNRSGLQTKRKEIDKARTHTKDGTLNAAKIFLVRSRAINVAPLFETQKQGGAWTAEREARGCENGSEGQSASSTTTKAVRNVVRKGGSFVRNSRGDERRTGRMYDDEGVWRKGKGRTSATRCRVRKKDNTPDCSTGSLLPLAREEREGPILLTGANQHFFAPLGNGPYFRSLHIPQEQMHILDWWEGWRVKVEVGSTKIAFDVTCTPAQHFTGRGIFDQFKTLWASWTDQGVSSTALESSGPVNSVNFEVKATCCSTELALRELVLAVPAKTVPPIEHHPRLPAEHEGRDTSSISSAWTQRFRWDSCQEYETLKSNKQRAHTDNASSNTVPVGSASASES